MTTSHDALLRRCDAYLDAVASHSASPHDVGPLRAFVSRAPWPYYARPRPNLAAGDKVRPDDVRRAAQILQEAGQPVSFEWLDELVPSLRTAVVEAGYVVRTYPFLARELGPDDATGPRGARTLGPDDPAVLQALQVSEVAFGAPGTATGSLGPPDRDVAVVLPALLSHVRERVRDASSVIAVLDDAQDGVVACGWHQPVGDATEIVGVATLPSHRRRGAGTAVVRALLADGAERGCTLALLSASDDAVAGLYEAAGFVRVATSAAAEPAAPLHDPPG